MMRLTDYAYNRYALLDGFRTGSEDGAPLAPLLGHDHRA